MDVEQTWCSCARCDRVVWKWLGFGVDLIPGSLFHYFNIVRGGRAFYNMF